MTSTDVRWIGQTVADSFTLSVINPSGTSGEQVENIDLIEDLIEELIEDSKPVLGNLDTYTMYYLKPADSQG